MKKIDPRIVAILKGLDRLVDKDGYSYYGNLAPYVSSLANKARTLLREMGQ